MAFVSGDRNSVMSPGSPVPTKLPLDASSLVFSSRAVVLASILAAVLIAVVGSASEIWLGDENSHIMHVRAYMETGRRVPRYPLSEQDRPVALSLTNAPLWHTGLALLWKLAGESQVLAQFYQACFYLLLMLSVHSIAWRLWGPVAAGWAWLFAASTPMVCAYSLLLYQDVPGIAISALGLSLLCRRRPLLAGIILAMAYLTKLNMLTYAPWAVLLAAWWSGPGWKRRLAAAALVAGPIAAAFAAETAWRYTNVGNWMGLPAWHFATAGLSKDGLQAFYARPTDFVSWRPYPAYDPKAIVTHVGLAVLPSALLALALAWDKASRWLWGCFALAVTAYYVVFVRWECPQIRYLFPALLPLLLLCGRAVGRLKLPRWASIALLVACALQAGGTCAYVWRVRRAPSSAREAFAWIRQNTDTTARIMFPEEALRNRTGRVPVWSMLNPAYFTGEATDAQRRELLRHFRVSYIAVPIRRNYDREKEGAHAGGFAREFVNRAGSLRYLVKVYENPGFIIFRFVPSDRLSNRPPATGPRGAP